MLSVLSLHLAANTVIASDSSGDDSPFNQTSHLTTDLAEINKAQEKINQTVSEDRQKTNSLETELKALNADLKELNERVDNLMQLIIARCSAK